MSQPEFSLCPKGHTCLSPVQVQPCAWLLLVGVTGPQYIASGWHISLLHGYVIKTLLVIRGWEEGMV